MALSEKLELILSADPARGISEIQRFAKESDKSLTAVESSWKRFGATALKVGGAGIGVGGLLTQMASGDIEASNQLKAAIGQVGQSYDQFADRIDNAAESQARFGHTDEEVAGAVTTLTLAYNDTGKALDELQLVADLAARKHISLSEAASAVAKAHGGAGRLFKEFGIAVAENADGTKNYDAALGELSHKLTGQASAAADTWGGRLDALKAKAENFFSALGQDYGPAILGVSTGLTALGGITSAVTSATDRLKAAHEAAAIAAEGQAAAEGGSRLATVGVVGGLAIGTAALYAYGKSLNKTTLDTQELQAVTQKTGPELAKGVAELERLAQGGGAFGGMLADTLDKLVALGPAGVGTIVRIRDEVRAAGGDTSRYDAALDGARESQANLNDATAAGSEILGEHNDVLKTAVERVKDLTATQHAAIDPVFALEKALRDNATAQYEAAAAGNANADANVKAAQSAIAVKDASAALSAGIRDGTVSIDSAITTLNQLAAQGLITQGQADSLAYSFAALKATLDKVNGSTVDIYVNQHGTVNIPDLGPDANREFHGAGRAAGGPVMGGSSYLIGEAGPEVVTFGASGWITPNSQLGGRQIVQHIYGGNAEEQQAEASRRLRIDAMLSRP